MRLKNLVDPMYLSIIVLACFLYLGFDKLIGQTPSETAKEIITAALGVIFVIITTMYMLKKQTEIERQKDLNNEIFKKKLELYEKALSIWQRIGFVDDGIDQKDVAASVEVQLRLYMVSPQTLAACAVEITEMITRVEEDETRQAFVTDEKDEFFALLSQFSAAARKDLNLPDTEMPGEVNLQSKMEKAVVSAGGSGQKNYDRFIFEGQELGKGRLVLAVVKYVAQKNSVPDIEELRKAFPDIWQSNGKLRKSKNSKVVFLRKDAEENQLRAFKKETDIIKLKDGNEAVVSTQWGENIDFFVSMAASQHGLTISRLNR